MKLYAQHGHGDGQKTSEALAGGLIEGVIYSPKDITEAKLRETAAQMRVTHRKADFLFDPQFYACLAAVDPASNLGNLDEEESYAYFHPRRRSQLLSEKQLMADLSATMQFAATLPVTGIIAPNIVVPRSFDSAEAAISMDFIRNTREVFDTLKDKRPVYATLAVSHDALIQKDELLRFLNDLTMLDNRPDGFYILVGVNRDDARTELYHADVIAGWMLVNHVLNLNGYRVINGYSDILTPFLGAAGGFAGATGWWSNLRAFSMERFAPPGGGGRLPTERYLSCALLNRITYFELESLRNVVAGVLNRLPTDSLYPNGSSQPPRPQEVLQSWDAIARLNSQLVRGDVVASLNACRSSLEGAQNLYDRIGMRMPVALDVRSNDQHIEPLQEGIRLFAALAELDLA